MNDMSNERDSLQDFSYISHMMKRDWDDRARHDAKWFINSIKFQQTEEEFDQSGRFEVERWVLADLALLIPNRDPGSLRLLEIGCGVGRMTKHLGKIFGHVVGTDVSGEMIRQARERLAGVPNVELQETNGADLSSMADESYDLVLSAYVFQHVPSVEVITSNIREAWRVLKPGGVFRFQTIGITALDYEESEKDTWVGASFSESEIRSLAREWGAQLIAIHGAGTRYCWTTVRKRPAPEVGPHTGASPSIIFYCRPDAPEIRAIPTHGDHSAIALFISSPDYKQLDCNSVAVEVGDQISLPYYVGPVKSQAAIASRIGSDHPIDNLIEVEIGIPIGTPAGISPVRVMAEGNGTSAPVEIEFEVEQPIIPRIGDVVNAYDNGRDIYAYGKKSRLRLLVEGLNEAADNGNLRVQIGQRITRPTQVVSLSLNGPHQIEAQIPEGMKPGSTEVCIYFGNVRSPSVALEIR